MNTPEQQEFDLEQKKKAWATEVQELRQEETKDWEKYISIYVNFSVFCAIILLLAVIAAPQAHTIYKFVSITALGDSVVASHWFWNRRQQNTSARKQLYYSEITNLAFFCSFVIAELADYLPAVTVFYLLCGGIALVTSLMNQRYVRQWSQE